MSNITNQDKKLSHIKAILDNPVYSEHAGLVVNLRQALLKLPLIQLGNLKLLMEVKQTELVRRAQIKAE